MPEEAIYVGRPTKWGNPFIPGKSNMFIPGRKVEDARHAARLYTGHAPHNEQLVSAAKAELAGHDLACWCGLCDLHKDGKPLGSDCPYCEPCHADTLLLLANSEDA